MVRKKKKKLTSQEKGLREVLRKLGYGNRITTKDIEKFSKSNIKLIKKVDPNFKGKYPSQEAILFAYYKNYFDTSAVEHYDFKVNENFNNEEFLKQVNRTCRRISRVFKHEKYLVKWSWPVDDYVLIVIYIIRKGSRVGIHNLIRPDDRSIEMLAAIYLDKNKQKIYVHHIPLKVLPYFNLTLQDETQVNFVPLMSHKEISWNSFPGKLLSSDNLELVEIGLNKTDFATGDQIIIKPKDRDARNYLQALLDQEKIISTKTFNLSYIDYIKVRLKDGKYNLIKFKITEDGIVPNNLSNYKDRELIKVLEKLDLPVGTKIVDPNKISQKILMQQLLMSWCISKGELTNKGYSDTISYLDSHHLIKNREEKNLYFCIKCRGSAFLTNICPECKEKQPVVTVPNGVRFNFDIQKIKNDIKKKLMKHKIKYRHIKKAFYNNRFELQKAVIPELPEINIYFNLSGLYQSVLKNFKLCPLPLLIINFRGEMKDDLRYIHQIDAADLITDLYEADDQVLINKIKNAAKDTRYAEKKEIAFKDSLNRLKELKKSNEAINSRKGNEYEWLTFNILSYLFPISSKWGGKSLPDGIIGFNKEDKKFAFWDSKRYDYTKLSNYAKKPKGGIGKDIKYVLKSVTQEDTYEEGKLGYYIFVTSNTQKKDFLELKQALDEKIDKERDKSNLFKRLKQIKFCCINLPELIKLGETIENKNNYENLQRKSQDFDLAFEQLLITNDGYLSESEINNLIVPLTKEHTFIPDKSAHRIS